MRKNLRYVLQQQPIFKQVVNSLHSNLHSIIALVRVFHQCGFMLVKIFIVRSTALNENFLDVSVHMMMIVELIR